MAILKNLLGIDNQTELAKATEKASKTRAKELVEKNVIDSFEVGTFKDWLKFIIICFKIFIILRGKPEKLIWQKVSLDLRQCCILNLL